MKNTIIATIIGIVLISCQPEQECNLCITTFNQNGEELRRESQVLCDLDFKTVEQMESISSYQFVDKDTIFVRTWCRRYAANE